VSLNQQIQETTRALREAERRGDVQEAANLRRTLATLRARDAVSEWT
jgi:hypothetical protein